MALVLDAIAADGGDRAAVTRAVRGTQDRDSIRPLLDRRGGAHDDDRVAVLAEGVEGDELHACPGPVEREPCAPEHVAAQTRNRPAQRQARVDPVHAV
jgi:hypothetical protein